MSKHISDQAAHTEAGEACGDCGHTHTPNGCAGPAHGCPTWDERRGCRCAELPAPMTEPQAASWCCPACRAEGWMCPALCQRPCCAEHALAAERVLCACGHAKFMHGDTAGDSGCRSCKCWSWRPATANPLDDLCCDGEGCPRCDPEPQAAHTEAGEGQGHGGEALFGEVFQRDPASSGPDGWRRTPFACHRCRTHHETSCCHASRHNLCDRCVNDAQERRYNAYIAEQETKP